MKLIVLPWLQPLFVSKFQRKLIIFSVLEVWTTSFTKIDCDYYL